MPDNIARMSELIEIWQCQYSRALSCLPRKDSHKQCEWERVSLLRESAMRREKVKGVRAFCKAGCDQHRRAVRAIP